MSGKLALESVQAFAETDARRDQQREDAFDFSGPWFDTRTAAAWVGSKSVKALREWCRVKGIVPRNNGTIAKVDLDRVLRRKRARHRMHAASLANLRKRWRK